MFFEPLNPLTFAIQTPQPSYIRQLLTIQQIAIAWVYSFIKMAFSISASSLVISKVPHPLLSIYCAPAPWNGLAGDFRQLAHYPISPCQFHSSSGCTLLWCLPLATEDRSLRNLYYFSKISI